MRTRIRRGLRPVAASAMLVLWVAGVCAVPNIAGAAQAAGTQEYVGFDRNTYPGEGALPALRKHFRYVGYWLNVPPGAHSNGWVGKRETLRAAGFGFLVLWNGRLDAELLRAGRTAGAMPATTGKTRAEVAARALGERDGRAAADAAKREGFPGDAILFLDQEEGGRMLPEQAAYLLTWTETVAKLGYRPGVYGSGQPSDEGPAPGGGRITITTAQDIEEHVRAEHLHPIVLWVAEDSCPPANGCSLTPPPLDRSGTPGALVWQYAQSPRRPEITRTCAKTYAVDGNCAVPELPAVFLDLNVSSSADPSGGR